MTLLKLGAEWVREGDEKVVGGTRGKARTPYREGVADVEALGMVVVRNHSERLDV